MTGARNEHGFTLIELLVGISLTTVVVMATVSAFASFHRNERVNRLQNESQDAARNLTGNLSRELRNLASPTDNAPESIDVATGYDLVFLTAEGVKSSGSANERGIKRVRYCLGPTAGGKATLYRQEQTWTTLDPPAVPSTVSCPDGGWPSATPVVHDIANGAAEVPLFAYTPGPSPREDIRGIQTEIVVDVNPGESPVQTSLESGVFLRNQNRAPVASCTATHSGTGGQVVLNGSASQDPEGRTLGSYTWYLAGDTTNPIAQDIVALWTAPASGTYTFELVVEDHAGLEGRANCQETVP